MRIALIGLGHIAPSWTFSAQYLGVQISYICDLNKQKLEAFKNEYNLVDTKLVSEVDQLREYDDFDLAVIATPPATHFQIAKQLLQRNKKIVIEKPVSSKLNEIDELLHNKNVFVALHAAYAPDLIYFVKNRATLENGLGKLKSFWCEFFDPYIDKNGEIASNGKSMGGSYLDSCVNALSAISKILDVSKVKCLNFSNSLLDPKTVKSHTLYSDGQIEGNILTEWRQDVNYKCTKLFYEKGFIELNHSTRVVTVFGEKSVTPYPTLMANVPRLYEHYVGVLKHIIELNEQGKTNSDVALSIHKLLLTGSPS